MRVQIVAYDPAWPAQFETARVRIKVVLGDRARRIEHIGSTAVPGLAAKPVIDVLLEVADVADPRVRSSLQSVQMSLTVDEDHHKMFRGSKQALHVHIWQTGDPEIDRHLRFRDRLRNDDDARRLYESEKRRLAELEWTTQNDYAQAKSRVITEILEQARERPKPLHNSGA